MRSLLVGLLALGLAACTPAGITAVRKSVTIAEQVQTQGILSFELWDLAHQKQLKEASVQSGDGMVSLVDYRAKREKFVLSFEILANVSHAAKNAVDVVAAKAAGKIDTTSILMGLLHAAKALQEAGDAIGFKVPGLSALIGGI